MIRTFVLGAALAAIAIPARAGADTRVTGDGFVASVELGATTRVVIAATGGYHVNKDFPISLEIAAGEAVVVDRARQGKADATIDDRRAVFAVKLAARKPGSHPVTARVRFAICTADSCLPRKATLAWNVAAR